MLSTSHEIPKNSSSLTLARAAFKFNSPFGLCVLLTDFASLNLVRQQKLELAIFHIKYWLLTWLNHFMELQCKQIDIQELWHILLKDKSSVRRHCDSHKNILEFPLAERIYTFFGRKFEEIKYCVTKHKNRQNLTPNIFSVFLHVAYPGTNEMCPSESVFTEGNIAILGRSQAYMSGALSQKTSFTLTLGFLSGNLQIS